MRRGTKPMSSCIGLRRAMSNRRSRPAGSPSARRMSGDDRADVAGDAAREPPRHGVPVAVVEHRGRDDLEQHQRHHDDHERAAEQRARQQRVEPIIGNVVGESRGLMADSPSRFSRRLQSGLQHIAAAAHGLQVARDSAGRSRSCGAGASSARRPCGCRRPDRAAWRLAERARSLRETAWPARGGEAASNSASAAGQADHLAAAAQLARASRSKLKAPKRTLAVGASAHPAARGAGWCGCAAPARAARRAWPDSRRRRSRGRRCGPPARPWRSAAGSARVASRGSERRSARGRSRRASSRRAR